MTPKAVCRLARRASESSEHGFVPMDAPFSVGDVVEIEQRVWSGMNKEGGTARVTKVNADGTLAVAYILTQDKDAAVPVKVRESAIDFIR